jgi:hypothetical protein
MIFVLVLGGEHIIYSNMGNGTFSMVTPCLKVEEASTCIPFLQPHHLQRLASEYHQSQQIML